MCWGVDLIDVTHDNRVMCWGVDLIDVTQNIGHCCGVENASMNFRVPWSLTSCGTVGFFARDSNALPVEFQLKTLPVQEYCWGESMTSLPLGHSL
jgi:hypothetical protein